MHVNLSLGHQHPHKSLKQYCMSVNPELVTAAQGFAACPHQGTLNFRLSKTLPQKKKKGKRKRMTEDSQHLPLLPHTWMSTPIHTNACMHTYTQRLSYLKY